MLMTPLNFQITSGNSKCFQWKVPHNDGWNKW